jgi:hypothetical protein
MSANPSPARGRRRPIKALAGRNQNSIPTTLTLDPESKHLLREMASSGKSYGSFVSGLIRAEWSRMQERQRLRELLKEEDVV